MTLEERLRRHFGKEAAKGDLSDQQWERVLQRVKSETWRRPVGGPRTLLTARRPVIAIAASLVLAVMAGAISLWMTAPWEAPSTERLAGPVSGPPGSPGQPGTSEVVGVQGTPSRSGVPAPRYIEDVWEVDKSVTTPGEPITATWTLKNLWDNDIKLADFSETVILNYVDTGGEEPIRVQWESSEDVPTSLEPGEEFIVVGDIASGVTTGLQPGRYSLRLQVTVVNGPWTEDKGESKLGFGGGRFVVVPPEGALDKAVIVDQAREVNGATIRLKSVSFAPEKTTIEVLAPGSTAGADVGDPAPPRPVPTATIVPQGTPTPTTVPVPPDDPRAGKLAARYRIDGGSWKTLRGHGYRVSQEGTYHEWTFGPVPANAETFELVIASNAHEESGETLLWEWVVPLQAHEGE